MINNRVWQEYLKGQVENGSIYLWGGQGENRAILTDAYIKRKETSTTNANRVIKLRDKRVKEGYTNLHAYDCSGLGVSALLDTGEISSDMTAHGLYLKCKKIMRSDLKPGDFVFRMYTSGASKGHVYHIGYVIDGLKVIHAKGRDVGVVEETLNQNGSSYWNTYGRSPYIVEPKDPDEYVFYRDMKKGMKGDDIKELQLLLNKNNFNCGSADGDFGKNTEKAVKACQKAHKLKQDGIAGKNTIKALGGKWR